MKILLIMLFLLPTLVFASKPPVHNINVDVDSHVVVEEHDEDIDELTAAVGAISAHQFDFDTPKLQVGIGVGSYESDVVASIGIAKKYKETVLFSGSATEIDDSVLLSVGATWRID